MRKTNQSTNTWRDYPLYITHRNKMLYPNSWKFEFQKSLISRPNLYKAFKLFAFCDWNGSVVWALDISQAERYFFRLRVRYYQDLRQLFPPVVFVIIFKLNLVGNVIFKIYRDKKIDIIRKNLNLKLYFTIGYMYIRAILFPCLLCVVVVWDIISPSQ